MIQPEVPLLNVNGRATPHHVKLKQRYNRQWQRCHT